VTTIARDDPRTFYASSARCSRMTVNQTLDGTLKVEIVRFADG
jgi:hypothetical protein